MLERCTDTADSTVRDGVLPLLGVVVDVGVLAPLAPRVGGEVTATAFATAAPAARSRVERTPSLMSHPPCRPLADARPGAPPHARPPAPLAPLHARIARKSTIGDGVDQYAFGSRSAGDEDSGVALGALPEVGFVPVGGAAGGPGSCALGAVVGST